MTTLDSSEIKSARSDQICVCIFSHLGVHFFHLGVQRGVRVQFWLCPLPTRAWQTPDCFHKSYGEEHMLVINHQLEPTSIVIYLLFTGGRLLSKVEKGGQGGIHVADVEICVTGANFISILPTAATCLHASLRCWQLKDCKEGKFGNVCLQLRWEQWRRVMVRLQSGLYHMFYLNGGKAGSIQRIPSNKFLVPKMDIWIMKDGPKYILVHIYGLVQAIDVTIFCFPPSLR